MSSRSDYKSADNAVDTSLSYILNELGEDRENYYNAIAPPIIQSSNFCFKTVEEFRNALADEYDGYLYTRGINPTTDILRKKLAALDGAEDCLVFNSGSSAIYAAVMGNVQAGDHIVSVRNPYTWAQKLFDNILPKFGIATTYIDGRDIEQFERAILPNTRIIYLESPNSWDYALQDLRAVAELARAEEILTICDNSYCGPLYQRPLEMGIDMVLQSATKYIGGHSDVVAGVLSGRMEMMKKIFMNDLLNMGNGISPFNAWLLLRGLRTLPVRMERIRSTTMQVMQFLKTHPRVEKMLFPFDPDFEQYELAKSQMSAACGLMTIVLKVEQMSDIIRFCESLQHMFMAVSWGGHESLIIPRCVSLDPAAFDAADPAHRMVRIYTGLEDPGYLIADLQQALDNI